jgi:putative endonuclease
MAAARRYHVYMMSNANRTLYVGVTSRLARRVSQHKARAIAGFTSKYHVHQLVYAEEHVDVAQAIAREKEIKGWRRNKKVKLIESLNPEWKDLSLSDGFFMLF